MVVRVTTFARVRELVGAATVEREIASDGTIADLWDALARDVPALAALHASVRFVRDGAFVDEHSRLRDGDDIGVLPPFGGG